jgi:hypothetical protein
VIGKWCITYAEGRDNKEEFYKQMAVVMYQSNYEQTKISHREN